MEMQMLMSQEAPEVEICETCQSGVHGCQHYFCMCDCRYPLPWSEGANVTHNTIVDANGETLAYDVISATRPSVIRRRILRAVNNHDALVAEVVELRQMLCQFAPLVYKKEIVPHLPGNLEDETKAWLRGRRTEDVLSAAQE